MTPALPVSPPDISSILASLGVFSLAIAAVVGGIYKGVKEVKKGGADTGSEVKAAIVMESSTLRELTESNRHLTESHNRIIDLLRSVDHTGNKVVEAIQDHRAITRSQIEEEHRLRAAIIDLLETMRRLTP